MSGHSTPRTPHAYRASFENVSANPNNMATASTNQFLAQPETIFEFENVAPEAVAQVQQQQAQQQKQQQLERRLSGQQNPVVVGGALRGMRVRSGWYGLQ